MKFDYTVNNLVRQVRVLVKLVAMMGEGVSLASPLQNALLSTQFHLNKYDIEMKSILGEDKLWNQLNKKAELQKNPPDHKDQGGS